MSFLAAVLISKVKKVSNPLLVLYQGNLSLVLYSRKIIKATKYCLHKIIVCHVEQTIYKKSIDYILFYQLQKLPFVTFLM